ncbi:unnamed protein product [Durusdinium trenchii]|uniref:Uncharacterized protein n=1 Tax=Durusdinium trenchii TaxID=1381693 RepID=A0ABP0LWT5_9DINO
MACNAAVCRSELQSTVRWWAAPATRAKEQDTQFDMYRCSSISKAQILIFRGDSTWGLVEAVAALRGWQRWPA